MKKFALIVTCVMAVVTSHAAMASVAEQEHPKEIDWSFDGMFGTVDKEAAQRGYQVYKEVCSACHAMHLKSYRNLQDLGFSEAEVKSIAAEAQVTDGPNDEGEMFQRAGRPSDHFVSPFANEQAARASNGGALPPDLSLIIKARHEGANYVYSLLTGYADAPADFKMQKNMHYNPYFPGKQVAMPSPLSDDRVTYQDGTAAKLDQEAKDVVNFLQWAAEPEMETRKRMGVKAMLFLALFTFFFYLAKKAIWRDLK